MPSELVLMLAPSSSSIVVSRYATSLSHGDQLGWRGRSEKASKAVEAEKGRVIRAEATISFLEEGALASALSSSSAEEVVMVVVATSSCVSVVDWRLLLLGVVVHVPVAPMEPGRHRALLVR